MVIVCILTNRRCVKLFRTDIRLYHRIRYSRHFQFLFISLPYVSGIFDNFSLTLWQRALKYDHHDRLVIDIQQRSLYPVMYTAIGITVTAQFIDRVYRPRPTVCILLLYRGKNYTKTLSRGIITRYYNYRRPAVRPPTVFYILYSLYHDRRFENSSTVSQSMTSLQP